MPAGTRAPAGVCSCLSPSPLSYRILQHGASQAVLAIVVLGVTGPAWNQALWGEADSFVGSVWRYSTYTRLSSWYSDAGNAPGNYMTNYVNLVYATAALGRSCVWNMAFAHIRATPTANTTAAAAAVLLQA